MDKHLFACPIQPADTGKPVGIVRYTPEKRLELENAAIKELKNAVADLQDAVIRIAAYPGPEHIALKQLRSVCLDDIRTQVKILRKLEN